MKTSTRTTLAIALSLSLLTAPVAFAAPTGPSINASTLVTLFTNWASDLTSLFDAATPNVDPGGLTDPTPSDLSSTGASDPAAFNQTSETEDSATANVDPAG